jgi:Peptidase inhibitor I78 family
MRVYRSLLTSVFIASLLTGACGGHGEPSTRPPSVAPSDPRGPVPPPQPTPPSSGTCDAAQAQWAVGEPASNDLLERARVAAKASIARFIRPNEPITMEFSPARLNLGLDKHDVVASVTCG